MTMRISRVRNLGIPVRVPDFFIVTSSLSIFFHATRTSQASFPRQGVSASVTEFYNATSILRRAALHQVAIASDSAVEAPEPHFPHDMK
jgi:hypothetical protein